jgi:RND superfamily putative drug exporter
VVVVEAADVTAPEVKAGIAELREAALATGRMSEPTAVEVSPDRRAAIVSIPVDGDGTDDASNAALAALREQVIPQTIGAVAGAQANVTGTTAGSKDFNDQMKRTAPLVFAFVLSLAFLLLLVTFRSIVIPIKAIVLNLLSVAAAYGVLVVVFQHGWGAELIGVEEASQGAIVAWLPMFLFVILFGLSMDYHVFILSRIREAFDRGMSTEHAIEHGIRGTASVVTSAAVVMVAVFGVFGTLSFTDMKQMGVGLAVAVLLDATIVRGVLLPATMKLLGDWNWYLPGWMGWLPRVAAHEPRVEPARA